MLHDPQETLREITRRLVDAAHPKKIILFGSYAKGTPHEDSDIDLLVIEDHVVSKHLEMVRLRQSLKGIPTPIDVLVVSYEEFVNRKGSPNNICNWADIEGKVIYDATG